jgi:hypothetical protein
MADLTLISRRYEVPEKVGQGVMGDRLQGSSHDLETSVEVRRRT